MTAPALNGVLLTPAQARAPGAQAGGWFGAGISFNTEESGCLAAAVAWMIESFPVTGG